MQMLVAGFVFALSSLLSTGATASPEALRHAPDTSQFRAPPRQASSLQARARHAVGFGVGYQPGPGLRLTGTYEYAGFPSGVLALTAGWSERPFGSVRYTHEVALTPEPFQRLLASAAFFSDYMPNRLLEEVLTDERRTGGELRLEVIAEGQRNRQYQAHLEGQRARVQLHRDDEPDVARWLTAFGLGGQYIYARRTLLPEVLLGTQARTGWDDTSGRFVTLSGAARLYRPVGGSFGIVSDAQARWVSPDTPAYERVSFGGMESVRGYRVDAALGRRLWTVQSELWSPMPGTAEATTDFGELLQRHVRLATFFDVGGITPTGTLDADVRTGLGLGLRLIFGPVTLRVDWGHRTTAVLDGHFRGDLYVSARSNVTLLLQ